MQSKGNCAIRMQDIELVKISINVNNKKYFKNDDTRNLIIEKGAKRTVHLKILRDIRIEN